METEENWGFRFAFMNLQTLIFRVDNEQNFAKCNQECHVWSHDMYNKHAMVETIGATKIAMFEDIKH